MIVDRQTGDVFLFYNYMNLDKAKDIYEKILLIHSILSLTSFTVGSSKSILTVTCVGIFPIYACSTI